VYSRIERLNMKLLQFLFRTLWTVGYLGNGILVLYVEWSYLRLSFIQIFNPFVHWQVAGTLLTSPLFWVLLGISSLGYYGYTFTEKRIKKYEQIKQSRKISIENIRSISPDSFKSQKERTPVEEPSSLSDNPVTRTIPVSSVQQGNVKASSIESERPKKSYAETDFYELQRIAYSNWSDAEILHKTYCELETIPSQKSEKLRSTITQWLKQLQKRPHIGSDFYELQRISYSNWNDIEILSEVHYELRFLSEQKGQDLCDKISLQLKQLQKQQPVPPDLNYSPEKAPVSITYPTRQYLDYRFNELKELVNQSWSNVQILSEIQNELGYRRSRRKHKILYEDIVQRLIHLRNQTFPWPNTAATSGSGNLSSDVFINPKGVLKQYGYKVGMKGIPESQRRNILNIIFLESLSSDGNAAYLSDWGNPNTSTRLRKMAESIAAFTRNGKRHNINDFSQAIQDWESDLAYLKRTYYEGHFDFYWPRTDT
jgi:hypothetical protein